MIFRTTALLKSVYPEYKNSKAVNAICRDRQSLSEVMEKFIFITGGKET